MRLIIYAGREFKADFTVVSSDGVTGEVLDPSDTATISIMSAGETPVCILDTVDMSILDADNGMFELTLTAEQTALLEQKVGFEEDNFSPLSNYDGYMDFTLVSGNRQAHCNLYVKGSACQTTV